jgi:hypothetical protein
VSRVALCRTVVVSADIHLRRRYPECASTRQQASALRRTGFSAVSGRLVQWEKGDFLSLAARSNATFYASSEAALH